MMHLVPVPFHFFKIERCDSAHILRLTSLDNTNRLTRACVKALIVALEQRQRQEKLLPLIITGNTKFFSVGADLNQIAALTGPEAYEFSALGQSLMNSLANHPAQVIAAIEGHCIGGGLDLALACHRRIAAPNAVFGNRGAALGLITGWGGTQRLPRLIGKARALELFTMAETILAARALAIGMVDRVAVDPVTEGLSLLQGT